MSFGRNLSSFSGGRSTINSLLNKVDSQLKGGKSATVPATSVKPSRGHTVEYYGDDDDDDAKEYLKLLGKDEGKKKKKSWQTATLDDIEDFSLSDILEPEPKPSIGSKSPAEKPTSEVTSGSKFLKKKAAINEHPTSSLKQTSPKSQQQQPPTPISIAPPSQAPEPSRRGSGDTSPRKPATILKGTGDTTAALDSQNRSQNLTPRKQLRFKETADQFEHVSDAEPIESDVSEDVERVNTKAKPAAQPITRDSTRRTSETDEDWTHSSKSEPTPRGGLGSAPTATASSSSAAPRLPDSPKRSSLKKPRESSSASGGNLSDRERSDSDTIATPRAPGTKKRVSIREDQSDERRLPDRSSADRERAVDEGRRGSDSIAEEVPDEDELRDLVIAKQPDSESDAEDRQEESFASSDHRTDSEDEQPKYNVMLLDEANGEAKPVSIPLRLAGTSEPRDQSASAESYESDFESEHSHSQSQSSSREQLRRQSPPASEPSYRSDTFEDEQEGSERAAGGDAHRSSRVRDRERQQQQLVQPPRATQSHAADSSGGRQRRRSSSPTVSASVSHTSASASLRVERDKCVQVNLSATAVGVNVTHPVALTNELRDALVARLLETLHLNPTALAAAGASASGPFMRAPGMPLYQPVAPRLDPTTLQALATNAESSRELTQSLMTEHLQQIRSFFDTQRQYYVAASAGIVPDFHYTSLEDTQQYIERHHQRVYDVSYTSLVKPPSCS